MSDDTTSGMDAEELRQMLTGALAQEPPANTLPGLNDIADIIGDERPEIDVTNTSAMHLWLLRNVGVGHLDHLYRKHGSLVRVVPGAIEAVRDRELRAEIDYIFRSVKITEKHGKQDTNFPMVAAQNACGAVHRLMLAREIEGVTAMPLFRHDGELIDTPGYDALTKMLYQPDPDLMLSVPEEPTHDEVLAATELIARPVAQFPFVSEDDRANWFGMAFTPLLRYIAPGPYKLGIIEAHQSGSGKGFLVGMLSELHGGTLRGSLPDTEAEMRKTITTALMGAEGIVVFDNVRGKIGSQSLEALLTAKTWSDRLLGGNQNVTLTNDRLWVITGNNAAIGGDMARRTIRVRLDAGPEPEKRTGFAIKDPLGWMEQHRGRYLSALLTIIRAWYYAGAPLPDATSSDSYARWRQVVSGLLQFSGLGKTFDDDSMRPKLSDEDAEWRIFLTAVHGRFGMVSWRAAELTQAILMSEELRETMPSIMAHRWNDGRNEAGFTRSLGNFLGNKDKAWLDDIRVEKAGEHPRTKVALWQTQTR